MARLRDTVLPLADYPNGTHEGTFNLGDSVTGWWFEIARCTSADPTIWPNASTTISVQMHVSFDNGQTWQDGGWFTAEGGIHVKRDSTEATAVRFSSTLRPGTNRKLRAQVTIAGGPLRSFGTLEVLD